MTEVLRADDIQLQGLIDLLDKYHLSISRIDDDTPIPGSFWGDEEAGLISDTLYLRGDTPVHSVLHESCHYICVDEQRRQHLHTNAGSDTDEENAVCYLQILLADQITDMGRARMLSDMDSWGYSFRLGSARAWFESDAEDARTWLLQHGIIDEDLQPTFFTRIK